MSLRRPLDLLDRDLIFSQLEPLYAEDFIRQAKQRGVALGQGELEAFRIARVVQPLYRVARDIRTVGTYLRDQPAGTPPSEAPAAKIITTGHDLCSDRDAGRVLDPRSEEPKRQRHYRSTYGFYPFAAIDGTRALRTIQSSEFLYSPHQLLLLPLVRHLLPVLRRRRMRDGDIQFTLSLPDVTRAYVALRVAANDDLMVGLSVFDTAYRWRVTGQAHFQGSIREDEWEAYVRVFDPAEALDWLGWTPERLLSLADGLLTDAHRIDPLADEWQELVRLATPRMWEKLRGDALITMDHRIAAEMLLQVYEDLAQQGRAVALPALPDLDWHPRHDRLRVEHQRLDGVLTRFGLSPHPALVLVLEGEVEHDVMMPRVMDLLDVPRSHTTIQLANLHGISNDPGLLASYVSMPLLGAARGDVQLLDRPLTRFIVAGDAEGRYRQPEDREHRRREFVHQIMATVPKDRQPTQLENLIDGMVHIESWGDQPFELAHFTNAEIVDAIHRAHRTKHPDEAPHRVTEEDIESCRPVRGRKGFNLRKYLPTDVTKVDLAEELWPILRTRIEVARANGTLATIPVARVALKAWDEAQKGLRQRAFIRTQESLPSGEED